MIGRTMRPPPRALRNHSGVNRVTWFSGIRSKTMASRARSTTALALSVGLGLAVAGAAQATITLHTAAFIGAPSAYNGFEHIPEGFGVPYVEQGIAVRYVTD